MKMLGSSPLRTRRLPLAAYLLTAAGLVAAAALMERSLSHQARRRAGTELDAVAALKAEAVRAWMVEQERNAAFAAGYPFVATAAAQAAGAVEPSLRAHGEAVLGLLGRRHQVQSLGIFDATGRGLITWAESEGARQRPSPALLERALAVWAPVLDLQLDRETARPCVEIVIPIQVEGSPPCVAGLRADMGPLYESVVESWPVPSRSARASLLLREPGEGAVTVLHAGGGEAAAPLVRIPLDRAASPEVQAFAGAAGPLAGVDERGVPVLAVARPIPGTGWLVAARMDLSEVDAPLRRPMWTIYALVAALLAVGGLLLAVWWRSESARARIEEELRESRDRFQLALAGTYWVWDWDLAAGRMEFECGVAAALGLSSECFEGRPEQIVAALFHPEDRELVGARLEAYLSSGDRFVELEGRVDRNTGAASPNWILVRGSASRRDEAGRPLRITGVVTDVTERRALRAQLERAERMAGLGTLAAAVAHEVNNPLASVIANLDLLSDGLSGSLDPEAAQSLSDARDGAERVRDVVRSLKAFSRPGTGQRSPVELGAELEAAARIARNEIRHRASLEVKLDSAPKVVAVDHELRQAFLHLLLHAAKSVPEGRTAENRIALECGTDGAGWARVEVRDSGPGLSASALAQIFDPFTRRGPETGTGLGLAVAHGVVTALGGHIEVESMEGRGTTFRILLPPAPPAAAQAPAPLGSAAPAAARSERPHVLVIDDDPLVARSIVRTLGPDHQVESVNAAAEALARLEAGQRYDAILCDLMMPEMSGMELFERLSRSVPDQAHRIVFVTGGAFTERALEFLVKTTNPCVEKPFNPAQLRSAVSNALKACEALPRARM